MDMESDGCSFACGVFSPTEIGAFCDDLARDPLPRSRAGARHAMRSAVIAELANDARLLHLVRHSLGPEAVPYRATLFDKSPTSNWLVVWHQDTALPLRVHRDLPGWGPWSLKSGILYAHAPREALDDVLALRIHLDDSTAANGPLRVLPRTHCHGVLSDAEVQRFAAGIEPVECIASRGDVVAMRPLLIHASSKSRSSAPRRVLHIEYAASLHTRDGLELAIARAEVPLANTHFGHYHAQNGH